MTERFRRIGLVVVAVTFAIVAITAHTNSAGIAAALFLLTAVLPWSWHGWHEQPPADRQK